MNELLILMMIASLNYIILLTLLVVNKYRVIKYVTFLIFVLCTSVSCLLAGKTPNSIYLVCS